MSWTVPTFWIRHLLDILREQDLFEGVEIVEGHNLDHYFIPTKREILVAGEWPEYIVIREHVANHWQSENHMRFFDDEESARNYFDGGHNGE